MCGSVPRRSDRIATLVAATRMDPESPTPPRDPLDAEPAAAPVDEVSIQTVLCGRCGWPNACRVQRGMRALRFMCQWCESMTTGIVDTSLKRHIIF